MKFYAILALAVFLVLFVIMQWCLSLRPGRGWGLVMPVCFFLLLVVSLLQCINSMFGFFEPKLGIVFNDAAYSSFVKIAIIGLLLSLGIYALGCWYLRMKRRYIQRRKEQRLAAKRAAQARAQAQYFQAANINGDFSSFFNSPKGE